MSHVYVYIRTHIYTYMRYISTKPLSKKQLRQGHFLQGHGAAEEGHHPQVGQGACSGQVFAVFFGMLIVSQYYILLLSLCGTLSKISKHGSHFYKMWESSWGVSPSSPAAELSWPGVQNPRGVCRTSAFPHLGQLVECLGCERAPWVDPKIASTKLGKSLDLSILKALFDRGIQCTMQGIHSGSPLKATLGIAVETSQFNRYNTWLAARHPNLPAKSFANGGVSIAMLEASSIDRNMSTRIFAFLKYII